MLQAPPSSQDRFQEAPQQVESPPPHPVIQPVSQDALCYAWLRGGGMKKCVSSGLPW